MELTAEERTQCLKISQNIVYSKQKQDYEENKKELLETNLPAIITYYEKNWHPIRYDWVEGLKSQKLTVKNRASNRCGSINQKIKTAYEKNVPLLLCFEELLAILNSFKFEQKQRADEIFTKSSVFKCLINSDILKYQQYLKLYAFKFLQEQLKLKEFNYHPERKFAKHF